ncbi:AraC family transcriptional regulator [Mycobacterium hodleri]|uniref:AraC family transcriptional regulator n=1 Tax=Mycolicibacterium hodleri TaxID=49897 RepID=UPI0021F389FE|nr:AraC family transcriptional regulator [Mycolicibacterium hodleri]MCV7133268.1 AraC family transcriptional regulator [Mycolicibacterium hodleri]
MLDHPCEHGVPSNDLAEELSARSFGDGANVGLWPGLTIYRYVEPTVPKWDEIQSLSVCIVAQGRKAVTADGHHYPCDEGQYLLLRSDLHFQVQILDATPDKPFLAFVLEIDPAVVRRLSEAVVGGRGTSDQSRSSTEGQDQGVVSELDADLGGAVLRFLRSLAADSDRRVLAPLYQHELVYHILQRDRSSKLLLMAGQQEDGNSVAAALNYINTHLSEPLTVETLAGQVNLSSSAFSRRFRELTGRSPRQFVKETRLERARELLFERRLGVGDVSVAVGYASQSHFTTEFRARFGTLPRDYADAEGLSRDLRPTCSAADSSGELGPSRAKSSEQRAVSCCGAQLSASGANSSR